MVRDYFAEARAEPKRQQGAPIPLFERLVDEDLNDGDEFPSKRFYNKEELIDSIQREVSRILDTRSSMKKEDLGDLAEDALNVGYPPLFGLSDFSQYDGSKLTDYPAIERLCEQAINRYEPRLKNVRIKITGFDRQTASLSGSIQADLSSDIFQSEVTFPMTLKI